MTKTKLARIGLLIPAALLSVPLGLHLADIGLGSGPREEPAAAINHYIGAAKCKNCHNTEAKGNMYAAWEASKHAHAFETLATPAALAKGKERGIEKPQEAAECLRCHVTAYEEPEENIKRGFKIEQGVQCETCHGPGENHMKARLKAAMTADPADADKYVQIEEGEVEFLAGQDLCLTCHNEESPSFKPFCYYLRAAEIRHLNPAKPRSEAELDALLVCGCGDTCACKHGCEEGKCGIPPSRKGK